MQRELFFNSHAYGLEVTQDFGIGKTYNPNAVPAERLGSPLVVPLSCITEMRISVQLDHKPMPSAVEIGDVLT